MQELLNFIMPPLALHLVLSWDAVESSFGSFAEAYVSRPGRVCSGATSNVAFGTKALRSGHYTMLQLRIG